MALLEVNNLCISFGGLRAVDDFHISIEKGELHGLIGPNGAGKTTVFNLLTVWTEKTSPAIKPWKSTMTALREPSRTFVCFIR